MAKLTQITVSVGFTKNVGNFQTIRADASVTLELELNDDPSKVFRQGWQQAAEQVKLGVQNSKVTLL